MAGVVKEFGPKATYQVKARVSSSNQVLFYAVFAGFSDYVYSLNFDSNCKVATMTKIWNDGYAAKHDPGN